MKNNTRKTVSDNYYLRECCQKLMMVIDFGEKNAVTQKQITERTGFCRHFTERLLRQIRINDVVICTSVKGYFYPENSRELDSYIRRLSRSKDTDDKVLNCARKKLERFKERGL